MTSSPLKIQVIAPRPSYAGAPHLFNRGAGDGPGDSLTKSLKFLFSNTVTRTPSETAEKAHRERRATPRVPIELCCEERRGKRPYYRTTYDLSTFGLSTQYGHTYELGTLVDIRLHLPDDLRNPIDLRAEVEGVRDDTAGMRLAFRQPSAEAVRRIHKYLFARDGRVVGQA